MEGTESKIIHFHEQKIYYSKNVFERKKTMRSSNKKLATYNIFFSIFFSINEQVNTRMNTQYTSNHWFIIAFWKSLLDNLVFNCSTQAFHIRNLWLFKVAVVWDSWEVKKYACDKFIRRTVENGNFLRKIINNCWIHVCFGLFSSHSLLQILRE